MRLNPKLVADGRMNEEEMEGGESSTRWRMSSSPTKTDWRSSEWEKATCEVMRAAHGKKYPIKVVVE